MSRSTVWVIGDRASRLGIDVAAAIADRVGFEWLPSLRSAIQRLDEVPTPPDVVCLLEDRPGCFRPADLMALRLGAPLLRVLAVAGSWCEGPRRSDPPPLGATRLPWYLAATRLEQELARIEQNHTPLWGFPVTATDDERLLAVSCEGVPQGPGLVVIESPSVELGRTLEQACAKAGWATVANGLERAASVSGASAGVWDGALLSETGLDRLRAFVCELGGAPVLAVLDFPRPDDWIRVQEAGVGAMLAKPFALGDLWWHIGRLTKPGATWSVTRNA